MKKYKKFLFNGLVVVAMSLTGGCEWVSSIWNGSDEPPEDPNALPPIETVDESKIETFTPADQPLPARTEDGWSKDAIPGLNFPVIYFAYDQDSIGSIGRAKLEQVANYMLKHPVVGVMIAGNCDERGSEEYNRALGERRAMSVKDYLVSLGVPESRFKTISYGSEKPVAMGHNEAAWAKNRRAELIPHKIK